MGLDRRKFLFAEDVEDEDFFGKKKLNKKLKGLGKSIKSDVNKSIKGFKFTRPKTGFKRPK